MLFKSVSQQAQRQQYSTGKEEEFLGRKNIPLCSLPARTPHSSSAFITAKTLHCLKIAFYADKLPNRKSLLFHVQVTEENTSRTLFSDTQNERMVGSKNVSAFNPLYKNRLPLSSTVVFHMHCVKQLQCRLMGKLSFNPDTEDTPPSLKCLMFKHWWYSSINE